jgi:hypothetical protein
VWQHTEEKFLKLLETRKALFATAQSEKIIARAKKERDLAISSQAYNFVGRFRDYNRNIH